jgi:hypothetical protein
MLQATTIYIILRLFDNGSFQIDFDARLVDTMTKVAMKLEVSGFLTTDEVVGARPGWREWMHMESKRR